MKNISPSDLTIRKIPFDFTDVAFMWNPSMPDFSVQMNALSFWLLGFERYIIKAFSEAEALLQDEAIIAEAIAMKEQEAQHSLNHRRHVMALIERYPELKSTLNRIYELYDNLYEQESLKFHLAYIANFEGITPPLAKFLIENRSTLFAQGDARVGSLLLWHFIEELEHRSSAKIVYDAIVPNPWYRMSTSLKTMTHIERGFNLVYADFFRYVPAADLAPLTHLSTQRFLTSRLAKFFIPSSLVMASAKMWFSVLTTAFPYHNPANFEMPDWVEKWYQGERQGEDMTSFYGQKPTQKKLHKELSSSL